VLVEIILLVFAARLVALRTDACAMYMFLRNSAAKEVVTVTVSSGGCTMREAGSRTSRPIMAMLGLVPVTECGVI